MWDINLTSELPTTTTTTNRTVAKRENLNAIFCDCSRVNRSIRGKRSDGSPSPLQWDRLQFVHRIAADP
jgi:hypothetical protein